MFGMIMSCIVIYYLYNKTVTLENKLNYLEYEMAMMNKYIYDPSAPLLILDK